MSDQPAGVETDPVAQSVPPVAEITPEMLNKPQMPVAGGEDAAFLKRKLELEKQDRLRVSESNKKLNEELQAIKAQFAALQERQQATDTADLKSQGKFEELWKQANETIVGLKSELEAERAGRQSDQAEAENERLKRQAMGVISESGALSSNQMFDLLQAQHGLRRGETGAVEVVVAGASIPLQDHLANLKNSDSGYQHHFSPQGGKGMGAAQSATVAPGMNNPWRTGNFTEQMALQMQNPELAAALKAEAGR